jgi:hypothetical protein
MVLVDEVGERAQIIDGRLAPEKQTSQFHSVLHVLTPRRCTKVLCYRKTAQC